MASKALALSNPELLAEYVRESELKSFFEKRLAAPPDHMAMLIRNGEIIDTYKGAHFSIGGIFKSLKSLVVGSSHISILLADLKPFSLQTGFKAITKDDVGVEGLATLELQVNPDKPKNVMGAVNTCGYLTQEEVLTRFKPHLTDRVLEAAVRRVNADEMRGERGLQDHIQAEIMREIERVAGDLGLIVRAVSMEWAINEVEKQAMEKSVLDREQARLDTELEYLARNITRSVDSTAFQIQADSDLAKLQSATDEELEHMVLGREIRIVDARAEADRRHELEALAHEIEVLRSERVGRFENQLAEADHLVDGAKRKANLTRVHMEIDRMTRTHNLELKKLEALADLEIRGKTAALDINIKTDSDKAAVTHISNLQDLEQRGEDAEANRRIRENQVNADLENQKIKAEADARVAQLTAGAIMTPEQILAINAGLSSDVAAVLAEQARASASGSEQVMNVMREMVTQATESKIASESQAREMFRMGMEGAAGVAQGAGGGRRSGTGATSGGEVVMCADCGRENDLTNRCCIGCGKQLRN